MICFIGFVFVSDFQFMFFLDNNFCCFIKFIYVFSNSSLIQDLILLILLFLINALSYLLILNCKGDQGSTWSKHFFVFLVSPVERRIDFISFCICRMKISVLIVTFGIRHFHNSECTNQYYWAMCQSLYRPLFLNRFFSFKFHFRKC